MKPLALAIAAGAAAAQDAYPSRPIRLIVGFPPGGGDDGVARVMADHLARTLKQQVIVENKPGAGTTLAPSFVASAPPDGYTLLLAPNSVFGPDKAMWQPNVKYDETSFTPITKWASTFFVMAANMPAPSASAAMNSAPVTSPRNCAMASAAGRFHSDARARCRGCPRNPARATSRRSRVRPRRARP